MNAKRKGKARRQPKVRRLYAVPAITFSPEPEHVRLQCEAAGLYDTIRSAMDKLAQQVYLARRELAKQKQTGSASGTDWLTVREYAANILCCQVALSTRKAIEVLIPGEQGNLAWDLTQSVVDTCAAFQQAVSDYTEDFVRAACIRADWPTLRRVRDNGKDWEQLVCSIGLGSMLPRKGHFDPQRVAVSMTADSIVEIEELHRRYGSVSVRRLVSLERFKRDKALQSDPSVRIIRQWEIDILRMKLPPRNRSRESLRAWWEAVKLRLETQRRQLLESGLLTKYQQQAEKALLNKEWCRAKTHTRTWNLFLTLCRNAFPTLLFTEKTGETP